MYEKTDKTGLYRDVSTGAIVNKDATALEAYRRKKQHAQELKDVQQRQDRIESELGEIKDLLKGVLINMSDDTHNHKEVDRRES